MDDQSERRIEVARNFETFRAVLPTLITSHRGEFALMRHGEVVGYYPSLGAAVAFAAAHYDDQIFSVQEITDRAIDLGWYSHASATDPLQS